MGKIMIHFQFNIMMTILQIKEKKNTMETRKTRINKPPTIHLFFPAMGTPPHVGCKHLCLVSLSMTKGWLASKFILSYAFSIRQVDIKRIVYL